METWRPAPGWPRYEVSDLGNVRRKGGRLLRPSPAPRRGYLRVHLTGKGAPKKISVHRLVCEAFNGPQPLGLSDVLHGPLGKLVNTPANLRWGNDAMNYADRPGNGEVQSLALHQYGPGEKHRLAKLTADHIRLIRTLAGKLSQRSIAARFGITQGHVSDIVARKKWSSV